MIRLRPQILHQNGKPQFAVIPYADILAIQEELEDAACLRILRKAKASEGKSPSMTLSDVKARLGLATRRATGGRVELLFGAPTYERTDKPEGQSFQIEWPEIIG